MYRSPVLDDRTPYERDVLPFVRPFTNALVASLPTGNGASPARVGRHLDHGCGTGEVVSAVRAHHSVALDPNAAMCLRARARFANESSVEVVEGTLDNYLNNYLSQHANQHVEPFDLITSQLVLSFVPEPFREL